MPVTAGYSLDIDDGVTVEVLHPQRTPDLTDALGEHPLTLRVRYGDISFLLTSQLNQTGQDALIEAGEWPLATVMQLPAQGTARSLSEKFFEAVQPSAVVLQSDPANLRGDPDPDVLALLGDVQLFRTDDGGTVHFWTDGETLWTVSEK